MESSRGVAVRNLLINWRKSRASIHTSLRAAEAAEDCFVLELDGVLADPTVETPDIGIAVGDATPLALDLRDAVVRFVFAEGPDRFFEVTLRDGSRCRLREVPTAAGIH